MLSEAIKARPRLYDAINFFRPLQSSTEAWLDKFARSHRDVRFIKIGASDGLRWDSMRRFIVRYGWSGVLVEPLPQVYEMLRANYAYLKRDLVFLNAAVSDQPGCVDFWCASKGFCSDLTTEKQLFFLRQSSLDRDFVCRRVGSPDHVECCSVPCVTVNEIADKYMSGNVDLLFVDAEGHDADIIRSVDFSRLKPAIVYESHNLGPKKALLRSFLESHGYAVSGLDGDSVATCKT